MKYPLHPACAVWPQMTDAELQGLAADIKTNGQLYPILLLPSGEVIAGRNRMLACEIAGVEPKTETRDGDPVTISISENQQRRHMSTAELAFIGAKLATLKHGASDGFRGNQHTSGKMVITTLPDSPKTRSAVAADLGISATDISLAKIIEEQGTPEMIADVKAGTIGLRKAADTVRKRRKPPAPTPIHDQVIAAIRAAQEAGEPVDRKALEARFGLQPVKTALAEEKGRQKTLAAVADLVPVDISTLGKNAQERLAALERRLRAQLEAGFEGRVKAEVKQRLEAILAQRNQADTELLEQARVLVTSRRWGSTRPFNEVEFYKVLVPALHSDTTDASLRHEAFVLVWRKRLLLAPDNAMGRLQQKNIIRLPTTLEGMQAWRDAQKQKTA